MGSCIFLMLIGWFHHISLLVLLNFLYRPMKHFILLSALQNYSKQWAPSLPILHKQSLSWVAEQCLIPSHTGTDSSSPEELRVWNRRIRNSLSLFGATESSWLLLHVFTWNSPKQMCERGCGEWMAGWKQRKAHPNSAECFKLFDSEDNTSVGKNQPLSENLLP